jgi:hypothetical protein
VPQTAWFAQLEKDSPTRDAHATKHQLDQAPGPDAAYGNPDAVARRVQGHLLGARNLQGDIRQGEKSLEIRDRIPARALSAGLERPLRPEVRDWSWRNCLRHGGSGQAGNAGTGKGGPDKATARGTTEALHGNLLRVRLSKLHRIRPPDRSLLEVHFLQLSFGRAASQAQENALQQLHAKQDRDGDQCKK